MSACEGKVSEDHAPPRMKICTLVVLNSPACLLQRLVDMLTRVILRSRHGRQEYPFPHRKSPSPLGEGLSGFFWSVGKKATGKVGMTYLVRLVWRADRLHEPD